MTYEEYKDALKERTGESEAAIDRILDAQRDIVIEQARQGNEVRLPEFGKFEGVESKARKGRNPKTGEEINIPAKMTLKFRVFPVAKKRINA